MSMLTIHALNCLALALGTCFVLLAADASNVSHARVDYSNVARVIPFPRYQAAAKSACRPSDVGKSCTGCPDRSVDGCRCNADGLCIPFCATVAYGAACRACQVAATDGCTCHPQSGQCLNFCAAQPDGRRCKSCKSTSGAGCACARGRCVDACLAPYDPLNPPKCTACSGAGTGGTNGSSPDGCVCSSAGGRPSCVPFCAQASLVGCHARLCLTPPSSSNGRDVLAPPHPPPPSASALLAPAAHSARSRRTTVPRVARASQGWAAHVSALMASVCLTGGCHLPLPCSPASISTLDSFCRRRDVPRGANCSSCASFASDRACSCQGGRCRHMCSDARKSRARCRSCGNPLASLYGECACSAGRCIHQCALRGSSGKPCRSCASDAAPEGCACSGGVCKDFCAVGGNRGRACSTCLHAHEDGCVCSAGACLDFCSVAASLLMSAAGRLGATEEQARLDALLSKRWLPGLAAALFHVDSGLSSRAPSVGHMWRTTPPLWVTSPANPAARALPVRPTVSAAAGFAPSGRDTWLHLDPP
eukprot:jgi/Mesen1/3087/ME000184S02155